MLSISLSRGAIALVALFAVSSEAAAGAPVPEDQSREVEELKIALETLQSSYDRQIKALEERILQLEETRGAEQPSETDELAALRTAAQQAVETSAARPSLESVPSTGRQTSLNRLNPEISTTGIVKGVASDQDRDDFRRGEFELDIQAALDPFSRTRWTIAFTEEGEVEVEEGYLTWDALLSGLDLTAGKFRQRFGTLNRQHVHALPQTSYPLAIQTFFGEEGLKQVGLSGTWLLGNPWASANDITVDITDGENEFFAGEDFEDLSVLARVNNYWDLSPATYFEWGLTGMAGRTEEGGDARVFGTDFTYHWQPPSRAKYREITWRTEVLFAQRENLPGELTDAWGAYSYLEGLVSQNLYLGFRLDWTEDPFDPLAETWAVVPYVTWWQSEWVRLRGEYQYRNDELTGETENRFTLQLTWSAGPHKHDTY
jgi:hypothetical protein